MELRKISYFLKIVECGSLSKAAQSLNLSQPTLSRFLDNLETDVGVKLVTRSKSSSLVLTKAGMDYLQTAKRINALWTELDARLSPIRKNENQIIFGIHDDYLYDFAQDCAKIVTQRFPKVSIKIYTEDSYEIQQQVLDGRIHLGLCSYTFKNEALIYTNCITTEMKLVCSKEHSLSKYNDPVELQKLGQNVAFGLIHSHTVLRESIDQYLHKIDFTPNIKRTYMSHTSIANVLCSSPLLGFCPENNISDKLTYFSLNPPFYYNQAVCYPKNTELSPAEQYLITLLQNQPKTRILD